MISPYPLTRAVKALLIANGAVFLLQFLPFTGSLLALYGPLEANDVFGRGQVWRLVTYMFMHSKIFLLHLLFNMLALWMFGSELEQRWGTRRFVKLYFLFGIGSGLFSALYLMDPYLRSRSVVGASGAIMGLLTAYAVYYPNREILLFFILPVRAWMLVAGYAVYSLFFAFSQGSGVAELIHFGGIAVAFGYLKGWPLLEEWYRGVQEAGEERRRRAAAEQQISRKKYYEKKVDPILQKISNKGIDSLTKEEKKILTHAGGYAKDRLKSEKIVPFDLFKDKK